MEKVTFHDAEDQELDSFILDTGRKIPTPKDHGCILNGMEKEINDFHTALIQEVRNNPCQPIKSLYRKIRRSWTSKLGDDELKIFLGW